MKINLQEYFNQCHIYQTEDKSIEWLKQRKTGIGGSEASIILNINPYKTPYELFMEKKGNTVERITNAAIEKGNRLEQPLIDVFFALHPEYVQVDTKHISLKSKANTFMNANLDGAFLDEDNEKCILEIKSTTIQNKKMLNEWGCWDKEQGIWIDKIPDVYYCQVLHYMVVTGFRHAVVYALLDFSYKSGQETREVHIYYDDVLDDMKLIIDEEQKFWNRLENNNPPPFMKMNFR